MSLEDILKERIKNEGPISIAHFMAEALSHPEHGYYMTKDPFGKEGDFITAPEISQMFGELIGIWCLLLWEKMGKPNNLHIVECGPGRGTLMKDFFNGTKNIKGFHASINPHLVETSGKLQKIQKNTLKGTHNNINWHNDLSFLPDAPTIFIANELFDALPFHQFVMTEKGWQEQLVGVTSNNEFEFCLSDDIKTIAEQHNGAKIGSIIETCPTGSDIADKMAKQIKQHGGGAVIIDYGYDEYGYKDTLQAVKNHEYHNILQDVGDADITAHVDFINLANIFTSNGLFCKTTTQRDFLLSLGIEQRYMSLMKEASQEQQKELTSATGRLINPDKMGTLFKVITTEYIK